MSELRVRLKYVIYSQLIEGGVQMCDTLRVNGVWGSIVLYIDS